MTADEYKPAIAAQLAKAVEGLLINELAATKAENDTLKAENDALKAEVAQLKTPPAP